MYTTYTTGVTILCNIKFYVTFNCFVCVIVKYDMYLPRKGAIHNHVYRQYIFAYVTYTSTAYVIEVYWVVPNKLVWCCIELITVDHTSVLSVYILRG